MRDLGFLTPAVALFLSCGATFGGNSGQLTFHRDIEPLLQKRCQACHRPGEAAPFSLLTYKDARPWAKAIRQAVIQRKMPPWFANPAHGQFSNDTRLTEAEIARIRDWVDGGAPEGAPADAPPPREFSEGWNIGKPDLIVELPVDFEVPASGTIDYTWFASDMKLTEDKWIEKLEVRPGDRGVVHHALVFVRPPGSTVRKDLQPGQFKAAANQTGGDPAKPQSDRGFFGLGNGFQAGFEMIGDYVPNSEPFIALPDHARLVRAGSHMLFQMHYTANGKATKDRTKVGIVFAKKPPQYRVVNEALMNTTLRIPPGAPNHEVRGTAEFQHDALIGAFGPHMHLRGKAMRYELLRSGSAEPEVLLDVPKYDFNWQMKYDPVSLIPVKKGDRLRVTAWYDNSPNNPWNPDPTKEVLWGDQSWDEMLFAFFDFVIPVDVDPVSVTGGVPRQSGRRAAAPQP